METGKRKNESEEAGNSKREKRSPDRLKPGSPATKPKSEEKTKRPYKRKTEGNQSSSSSAAAATAAAASMKCNLESGIDIVTGIAQDMADKALSKEIKETGISFGQIVDELELTMVTENLTQFNGEGETLPPVRDIGRIEVSAAHAAVNLEESIPRSVILRIVKKILPSVATVSEECLEKMQICVASFISLISSEAGICAHVNNNNAVLGTDIVASLGSLGFDDYSQIALAYTNAYRLHQKLYVNRAGLLSMAISRHI